MKITDIEAIGAGHIHTCALSSKGTVLCWGSGAWGEYAPVAATGDGLTSNTATPASITGDCNITLTGVYGTSTTGTATGTGLAVGNATGNPLTSNTNDVN